MEKKIFFLIVAGVVVVGVLIYISIVAVVMILYSF